MITKILWIILIYCQWMTMIGGTWEGPFTLLFAWFLLYGLPLYNFMRDKQLDFELHQNYRIRYDMVSRMYAFLTRDYYKEDKYE